MLMQASVYFKIKVLMTLTNITSTLHAIVSLMMFDVDFIVIKGNDRLYNTTIVGYSVIGCDVDIHHFATASVNISILWWISRHMQCLNSQ